jgi:hypothetical protein
VRKVLALVLALEVVLDGCAGSSGTRPTVRARACDVARAACAVVDSVCGSVQDPAP